MQDGCDAAVGTPWERDMGPQRHVIATARPAIRALVTVTAIAMFSACSSAAAPPSPSSPPSVAPAPSATSTGAASPTAKPSPTPAPPMPTPMAGAPDSGVVIQLTASNAAWDLKEITGPAGKAFQIAMTNKDNGPHNLVVSSGTDVASRLATLDKFSGPATKSLDVPGLPAGTYLFRCTLHDSMRGQLTIK